MDREPLDRRAALALARRARIILVKAGAGSVRFEGVRGDEAEMSRHLVHEDGLLRVPVLVDGDVLVRGFTEALYREALALSRGAR